MNAIDNSNIHRYLDEAFVGIAMTPEIQDLKEEIRGNLAARVDELTARGMEASAAATKAVDELGDISELVDQIDDGNRAESGRHTGDNGPARPESTTTAWAGAYQLNRVRPKPLFVIRTVILSLILAVAAALIALGAVQVLVWPSAVLVLVAAMGVALPGFVIVADSLRQETSQHYPLPGGRSALYGASAAIGLMGISLIGLYPGNLAQPGFVVAGGVLALIAIIGFIWLGTTQTNRTKPWVRTAQRQYAAEDRFSQDPVAAARFGMYTVVIWLLAFAAFVVLSITIGFAWSWLALLAGFVVFFLTLARMLFPAERKNGRKDERQEQ